MQFSYSPPSSHFIHILILYSPTTTKNQPRNKQKSKGEQGTLDNV
jgi:hypothetical protein